jgi:hypothetical protein
MRPDLIMFPLLFFHAALFVEVCQLSVFRSDSRLFSFQFRRYFRIFIDTNGLSAACFDRRMGEGRKQSP